MDLSRIKRYLERLVAAANRVDEEVSVNWRAEANRRSVIILIALGSIALISYVFLIAPPSSFPTGNLIAVPEGASAK
jgi:hypothetical protein